MVTLFGTTSEGLHGRLTEAIDGECRAAAVAGQRHNSSAFPQCDLCSRCPRRHQDDPTRPAKARPLGVAQGEARTRRDGGVTAATMTTREPGLQRETFRTSRLLDFCSEKELVAQTGHRPAQWPLVVLKELLDNALDACEEAGIAPEVAITVNKSGITVADNGPGIPAETVKGVLDFTVRVSSREAYVSPTRGAQGNALKTIVAMPFVLDGSRGRVEIEARGIHHAITFEVDHVRQEPVIRHEQAESEVKKGTVVRVPLLWRNLAKADFADDREEEPTESPNSPKVNRRHEVAILTICHRLRLAQSPHGHHDRLVRRTDRDPGDRCRLEQVEAVGADLAPLVYDRAYRAADWCLHQA